jgi:hypothetical protein
MGFYINPPDMSKEDWLDKHGDKSFKIDTPEGRDAVEAVCRSSYGGLTGRIPPEYYPVCWVNNGSFTAAVVAYSRHEYEYFLSGFLNGTDRRPHRWYIVPRAALLELMPELEGVLL